MENNQEGQILHFEPSAYLQRLLGRELISNEYIAVAELVKNAYDAGATEVIVQLNRDTPDSPQRLIISDNGAGMSLDDFERLWMRPGYSEKEGGKVQERPLLGEKGIGRFAADKLAQKLTVVTKKVRENDALFVEFDWDAFNDRAKKMREIPIPSSRRSDPQLKETYHGGTRLEFENLRKVWTDKDWQSLRKELQNLVTPFRPVQRFEIIAKSNIKKWKSGKVESSFETQGDYKYSFSVSKGGRLTRSLSRPRKVANKLEKQLEEIERKIVGTTSFGPISGTFYYVERPGPLIKKRFEPGVGVYRDGFRVEPYGRSYEDWLGVKAKKASRHGHAPINPSKLFGFIEITRDDNSQLKDVTNREGLLNNPEFTEFRSFVMEEFRHFAEKLEQDKGSLELESPPIVAQQAQAVRKTRVQAFADMASQLAHQLRQPLNHIRMSSTNLKDLLKLSGALDENIQQLTERIERNIVRMDKNIINLSKIAKGLRDEVVEFDLGDFVKDVVTEHEANFVDSRVVLEKVNCNQGHKVKFSRMALEFILDNFLTNALRAVSDNTDRAGKVVIEVENFARGKYRLRVTDNGGGVAPEYKDKLFEGIIPSEHGDGQGLYWSRFWAREYGGYIDYEDAQPSGAIFFIYFEP